MVEHQSLHAPSAGPRREDAPPTPTKGPGTSMQRRAIHVLVVDDEPDICEVLCEYFCDDGFVVSCAQNGCDARRVLDQTAVDLALIDLVMPGEPGLSLAEHANRMAADVIVMTGHPDSMSALDGSAYRTISKPFRLAELSRMVHAAVQPRD